MNNDEKMFLVPPLNLNCLEQKLLWNPLSVLWFHKGLWKLKPRHFAEN